MKQGDLLWRSKRKCMTQAINRRDLFKILSAGSAISLTTRAGRAGPRARRAATQGWVIGRMTGAQALTETLLAEGADCVFGIPGAQQNELWDTFKSKRLAYLLVSHEFSAATMADGYARSAGRPGVLCVVPGPGVTNALSGLGESLLDSIPVVCIVGDVANGNHYRPFQVHSLPQAALLRSVTKQVIEVPRVEDIPGAVRQAFQCARAGEPGPAAVVVPYNLLIETANFRSEPLEPMALPLDADAYRHAYALLQDRRLRVGIYAGLGCMDYSESLVRLAEVLQAPVATSISGKGAIPENHALSVGWGYGPQATLTAEHIFKAVDLVLAIGVKYGEVSTGFYSQPNSRHLIHVDANAENLGRIMRTDVCVHADAGLFMDQLLADANALRRPVQCRLHDQVRARKCAEARDQNRIYARCGADPMALFLALRAHSRSDAMLYVDVSVSQYWATEAFAAIQPRTFFNPTNNQAMGWSIPAALGGQRAHPGRQVLTITGDGCFLMSGTELSTAARENLPVKFFILDDQAYRYMQELQRPAYLRTTATILARLDYRALARGWGVAYREITSTAAIENEVRCALDHPGPVLTRVAVDYRQRPIRWLRAARQRFTDELTTAQKVRFLARIGSRALDPRREEND
jgi:acetolactate synthase-1/2/3 large subunit